jgi:BirA family biotin operon repressor/biotin-[acetyl-CoA-carboxylase] ligase
MSPKPGWVVHHYDSVPSTMDTAASLASVGAPERTIVVASEQTAGRGRGGRSWQAPPGSGLFCTLILRPALPPALLTTLPLLTGVAVAEAIERVVDAPCRVKWPNDVWLGDDPAHHKVAGILVTSRFNGDVADPVLVGVGVNVSTRCADLPLGATSILLASGRVVMPDTVLDAVLDRFDRVYAEFQATRGRPSLAAWRSRAALLGERVAVVDSGREREGRFVGVDEDGALLLEDSPSAIRRIVAGELARGPRSIDERG